MKKVRWFLLFIFTIALSLNSFCVWAETEFFPAVKEIVIYTDGLGFVVREGEVSADEEGVYIIGNLPKALKGSLNVFSQDTAVLIEQFTTYQDDQITQNPIESRDEFFRQNEGKPIQVVTDDGALSGKIKSYLEPDYLVVTVTHENGVTSDHVYPLEKIAAFYLLEPAVTAKEVKDKVGKVRVKAGGARIGDSLSLGLSYLQTGITWTPEYTLNLQNNERGGTLSFSALVRNDLDDLNDATVYLAEDGPRFNREVSPLVIFDEEPGKHKESLLYAAEVAARGVAKNDLALSPGINEEHVPSLLMYKKSNIMLKKRERAVLPIFQGVVRVEPIFRLTLARSAYNSQLVEEPIWKGYRVHNDSNMHWIEGEVLVKMGDKPLALQKFPFIAPQNSGEIKVLTDKSVLTAVTEVEFERIQGALTYRDRQYSSIQVKGEIELRNTKNEDVTIKVSNLIPGEVSEAGDGAIISKKVNTISGPNPQTEVVWEVEIPAKGVKRLTYVYQTYVVF